MRLGLLFCFIILLGAGCTAQRAPRTPDPGNMGSPQKNGAATATDLPSSTPSDPSTGSGSSNLIVTPGSVMGRVALVNPNARFVIIGFPPGAVPGVNKHLNVYRGGLKVAELRVTGPQRDLNSAADILAGECQVGDEVRPD